MRKDPYLTWLGKCTPCKIGTQPMVVEVHKADLQRIDVGKWCRVRYDIGGRWEKVYVTEVRKDGYFMAAR